MTKRKVTTRHPETRIGEVQALHLVTNQTDAKDSVEKYMDYRQRVGDPVTIQQAMRLLINYGWQSIAPAAEPAREREATK
jgi:hypothetical protein